METHNYHSSFKSQFVDAQYTGNIEISTFISDFITSTIRRTAGNYLNKENENISIQNYIIAENNEHVAKKGS